MKPTRRWWTATGLGLLLAAWAVLVDQPVVLLGAAGIGGLLVAVQLRFVAALSRADIGIDLTPARDRATVGETIPLAVDVTTDGALLDLMVTPTLPASVEADPDSLYLPPRTEQASSVVDLTLPIAGAIEIPSPTVVVTDPLGLYEQHLAVEATASIDVDPHRIDDVHVGTGGEPVTVAFGEHESGRLGTGVEPAEIRRYVPGEAVRQMDWKATARRGEPHVREFEAETNRVTTLVLDVRGRLGDGPAGKTKLDHLRQVALAFVDRARTRSDPLGCVTVGDEGLTGTFEASANVERQLAIRRHLTGAEPTTSDDGRTPSAFDPVTARRRVARLGDDAFGRGLRPFLEGPGAYVERVAGRPRFAAIRALGRTHRGTNWTVLLTDDADRPELREAVNLARSDQGNVVVFLTPSVLFESNAIGDLEAAYEQYADFEEFRRSLAGLDRVEAFEVGPGDRLARVLAAGVAERHRGSS